VAQRVCRGIALLFHDRGTKRGRVVSSTPLLHFTPGKDTVLILQEVVWAPGPVWTGGITCPNRKSIPDSSARSQSLYRLSYPAHKYIYIYIYKHTLYMCVFVCICVCMCVCVCVCVCVCISTTVGQLWDSKYCASDGNWGKMERKCNSVGFLYLPQNWNMLSPEGIRRMKALNSALAVWLS